MSYLGISRLLSFLKTEESPVYHDIGHLLRAHRLFRLLFLCYICGLTVRYEWYSDHLSYRVSSQIAEGKVMTPDARSLRPSCLLSF